MGELSKLGRYELRRVLGKGAMGVVYEGFDPSLNRGVAVKTILKSVVIDEETAVSYSARFAREAKAAARLSHANIVQVYDFGEQDDIAYLVMEFIQGRELRVAFEARERFDVAETVRIMGELLEALEFAHQAGVVHRDVKPANVMLDGQRRVKLADFGVARLQDGNDRSKGGTMVGTPAFMSPEQISGARVDRRTDVFSAGIILYQLLTGEQPFKGAGAWTVAKQIMQDEPQRPSTVVERVPPAFDQIINRALAKKPDQRFASAKEFAAALRGALSGGAVLRGSDAEIEFWRSIQSSNDPAEFAVYLKEFPQGVYAELARIKMFKLPEAPAESDEVQAGLAAEKARLEAALAAREAEYRRREEEAEARRVAEAKALEEADARREAEASAREAAEEKARLEAVEKAKREAQAELARKEAEYRKREAEALARAEAEAKVRRDAEVRTRAAAEAKERKQAEETARARQAAEARATEAAEERARFEAEAARREEKLKQQLAAGPKAKLPLLPIAITLAIVAGAIGAWYWSNSSDEARVAALSAALEEATKASEKLRLATQAMHEARKRAADARVAEEAAQKSGDTAALKAATDARLKADSDAAAQVKLVQQREAEAKKAEEAAKTADAKKQTEAAKAAEKAAQEKAAAEKASAEKAAAEKSAAEKLATEKAASEKAAAEKSAAEKAAAPKAAVTRVAPAPGFSLPKPGDRWIYMVRDSDVKERAYEASLQVMTADRSAVSYEFRPEGKTTISKIQSAGSRTITKVAAGVDLLSPYLLAYERLKPGDMQGVKCDACTGAQTQIFPEVVGKERVSVPAGQFEAWKVSVVGRSGGNRWEYAYWYDDATGILVKYRRRTTQIMANNQSISEPDIEMELTAHLSSAVQPVAAPGLPLPSVGVRWVYSVRNMDHKDQVYEAALEVKSADSGGVSYAFTAAGTPEANRVQKAGTHVITNVAPNVNLVSPYLLYYEKLQPGELRGFDSKASNCAFAGSVVSCQYFPTVSGKERISVRAGVFEAWKIVVNVNIGVGSNTSRLKYTYWYDDSTGVLVKYELRTTGTAYWNSSPDMDMELSSYTPADRK